jgi:hypothetical protein
VPYASGHFLVRASCDLRSVLAARRVPPFHSETTKVASVLDQIGTSFGYFFGLRSLATIRLTWSFWPKADSFNRSFKGLVDFFSLRHLGFEEPYTYHPEVFWTETCSWCFLDDNDAAPIGSGVTLAIPSGGAIEQHTYGLAELRILSRNQTHLKEGPTDDLERVFSPT